VLQWFPLNALRNERAVSLEEVGPGFDEGQLPAVDTRGMGCEEFGIGARRSDPRLGQRRHGGIDCLADVGACWPPAEPGHVI
jgi:hypothetical protein